MPKNGLFWKPHPKLKKTHSTPQKYRLDRSNGTQLSKLRGASDTKEKIVIRYTVYNEQQTRAGRKIQPLTKYSTQELVEIYHLLQSWNKVRKVKTYYLPVCYLLRIHQYPVNTSYNNKIEWASRDRMDPDRASIDRPTYYPINNSCVMLTKI